MPIPPRAMPPEVNRLDHQIGVQNGSTSVLELSPRRVQLTKLSPSPVLSTRIEELTREVGGLRYEIQFYRQCFEILQRLRDKAYDVYQQIFLAYYLDHESDRLDELMTQLHHALDKSVRLETAAKRVWMDFWGVGQSEQEQETDFPGMDQDEEEHRNWI